MRNFNLFYFIFISCYGVAFRVPSLEQNKPIFYDNGQNVVCLTFQSYHQQPGILGCIIEQSALKLKPSGPQSTLSDAQYQSLFYALPLGHLDRQINDYCIVKFQCFEYLIDSKIYKVYKLFNVFGDFRMYHIGSSWPCSDKMLIVNQDKLLRLEQYILGKLTQFRKNKSQFSAFQAEDESMFGMDDLKKFTLYLLTEKLDDHYNLFVDKSLMHIYNIKTKKMIRLEFYISNLHASIVFTEDWRWISIDVLNLLESPLPESPPPLPPPLESACSELSEDAHDIDQKEAWYKSPRFYILFLVIFAFFIFYFFLIC